MNVTSKAIVLVVDGAADNLILLNSLLQDRYEVKLANNGRAALQVVQQIPRPDLILLDVALPEYDGYSVCQQLKSSPDTAGIPVIFLLDAGDGADEGAGEQRAMCVGGADVLPKPVVAETLLARVDTHLQLRHARELLKHQRNLLEHMVEEVTTELSQMLDAMIWAMASLAETRDNETVNHIRRVQNYVVALARELKPNKRFAEELSEGNIRSLYKAAPLHDIGKVGRARRDPAQAGPLDGRGVRDDEAAHRARARRHRRPGAAPRLHQQLPALRARDRLFAPGEMGRHRLSRGPGRRRHPACRRA